MDGEEVNATSGSPVLGGALWCGYLCNVLGIYGDATVESTDCKSCAFVCLVQHTSVWTIRNLYLVPVHASAIYRFVFWDQILIG